MEPKGIEKFELLYNTKVNKCGFFISKQYPFLGASPDGKATVDSQETLFECKWVAQKKSQEVKLDECIKNIQHFCLENTAFGYKLKRKHPYFYQV